MKNSSCPNYETLKKIQIIPSIWIEWKNIVSIFQQMRKNWLEKNFFLSAAHKSTIFSFLATELP